MVMFYDEYSSETFIATIRQYLNTEFGNHTIFRLDAHYSQTYLCAITK